MDKLANVRAFGEGLAGGQFDRQKFFKKPTVLFRCGGFILGALLWYSISKGGWYKPDGRVLQQVYFFFFKFLQNFAISLMQKNVFLLIFIFMNSIGSNSRNFMPPRKLVLTEKCLKITGLYLRL